VLTASQAAGMGGGGMSLNVSIGNVSVGNGASAHDAGRQIGRGILSEMRIAGYA